ITTAPGNSSTVSSTPPSPARIATTPSATPHNSASWASGATACLSKNSKSPTNRSRKKAQRESKSTKDLCQFLPIEDAGGQRYESCLQNGSGVRGDDCCRG